MNEFVIEAEHLQKIYMLYSSAKEKYLDFFLPKQFGKQFYALNDLTFQVRKGESLGLIGLNGSGKTTLSNILSGASNCSKGTLTTRGKTAAIAIGSGVDPMLTGLENIIQKGLLLGLDLAEIRELTPEIIAFAELDDFIEQQVKTYSSGMRARLGFAISVNINPDILIIDEALSVGDPTFTAKCLDKMNTFRERGKTIVFVSHSIKQVRDFCDRALWLQGGQMIRIGDCMEVTKEYMSFIREFNGKTEAEQRAWRDSIRQAQFAG